MTNFHNSRGVFRKSYIITENCYEIVLTCINYCRSIVVMLINIILVMYDIDYCRSCLIYVATSYVECGLVLLHVACAPALRMPA